jgi:hypothetical protein
MQTETNAVLHNHLRAMERAVTPRSLNKVEFWIVMIRAACEFEDHEQLHDYRRTIEGAYQQGAVDSNYVLARMNRTILFCDVSVLSSLPLEISIYVDTGFSSPEFNFEQLVREALCRSVPGFVEE